MSETYCPNNQEEISQFIYDSYELNKPIEITTLNSKPIGRSIQCSQTLDLRKNSGIIEYLPEELYIKVKAGTPLIDILELLKTKNQTLGFEPVDLGYLYSGKSNYGSVGGVVSCNLSGPRRFKSGALRDHLLGFTAVNGKGECIKSGGTVVKNVTGYDLSKLLAGSYGTLSVLTELILKVVPQPEHGETFILYGLSPQKALEAFSKAMKTSLEISGACYYSKNSINFLRLNDVDNSKSVTALRVEGTKKSVQERIESLNKILPEVKEKTTLEIYQSDLFWKMTANLECFNNSQNLIAKISLPPTETNSFINQFCEEEMLEINNRYFVEWAGGLVFLEIGDSDPSYLILEKIKKFCKEKGCHITIIKANATFRRTGFFISSSDANVKILTSKIKHSFDPKGILNPGKIYAGI